MAQQRGAGLADGEIHLWHDGTKTTEYTNVEWADADYAWSGIKWEPTWGGGGGTIVGAFEMFMDEIYLAGSA